MTVSEGKKSFWRSNMGIMMISSGFWRLGGRMAWTFWALYVLALGGDYIHIGLISAVSSLFSLIPAFFGGYLADTIGRKKMVYSMSFLLSINSVVYLFAPSWEWLLVGRSLDAIFNGLRQPAMQAILADSTTSENRAMSFGMWQAIPPIFGLLSPHVIGIMVDSMGIIPAQRIAYLVLLFFSSLGAFMRYRYLTETLPTEAVERVRPMTILRETLKDFKETTGIISRQLWILIFMGVLYQFGTSVGVIYLTNYAIEDVIHVSASQWGLTNTASILVGIIVSIPSARLIDMYGRRKMVLLSLVLTPVALMGFIYSRGFLPAFAFFNLMTALGSVGSVASQALFIDHSPREHRGRITALTSVIGATQNFTFQMMGGGTIIGAVGNMVGGALYHEGTYALPLYITAGMIVFTALLAAFFVKEPKEKEE